MDAMENDGMEDVTDVGKHLLEQPPFRLLVPAAIEANDSPGALEAVTRHLELVHGVNVLDVHLYGWTVGRFGCPEVEVLVATGFKVEGVVAGMQVGELVEQVEGVFRVEFGVCPA